MKTLRTIGAAIAACAAALLVPSAGSAAGSVTYADPTGDGRGAPDIQRVSVSNDDNGRITFRVSVDTIPAESDTRVMVALDTDRNADTGDPSTLGAEYLVAEYESDRSFDIARWDGAAWVNTTHETVKVYSDSTGVTFSIDRTELGNTSGFNYWVRSRAGDVSLDQYDDFPDSGTSSFTLQIAPPPPPPPPPPPTLKRILVAGPSLLPASGKLFIFRVTGLQLGTGAMVMPQSLLCSAKLAGIPIRGRGKGGCTWKLVTSTKGRKLVVTVDAVYRGATGRWRFPLKVT
jgi:hypothetical protein